MIRVRTASPDQLQTALSLLLPPAASDADCETQLADVMQEAAEGRLCFDHLLLAEIGEEPAGAGLLIFHADGTAYVWPPAVAPSRANDSARIVDAILQEVCTRIDGSSAWIGQSLLEPGDLSTRASLTRNGFAHLTDMIYVQRFLDEPLPPRSAVTFETVTFDHLRNRHRFARLLERTYCGTRDCPELEGLRSGEAALSGHQLTGQFVPSRWKVYCVDGEDVGVLLLNGHPEQSVWEVVYMGVVAEVRGRGLGRDMLLSGLYEARAMGTGSVLLAVDSRNVFARAVYDALGFVEVDVRAVLVRRPSGGSSLK